MTEHNEIFDYGYRFAGLVDIGKKRDTNQDEIIFLPEQGFFAVSDGMGGLANGGKTAWMVSQVITDLVMDLFNDLTENPDPNHAASQLVQKVAVISDSIYKTGNSDGNISFGATICSVLLIGHKAIFINLGDSRGYYLPYGKKDLTQVTRDHNIAWLLFERGELTKNEVKDHPSGSRLTRFIGMEPPSTAETFIVDIHPGDKLLLCSDGLYGMVEEDRMLETISLNRKPETICQRLIKEANDSGGKDNISVVYIEIKR